MCSVSGGQAALCVVNFVEALVFGLFVIIMMFDQFSAIFESGDPDAAYSHVKGMKKRSRYESLKEVFGSSFNWRWFFPVAVTPQIQKEFLIECREAINDYVPPPISTENSDGQTANRPMEQSVNTNKTD